MSRKETLSCLAEENFYKGGHPLCPGCTGATFWRMVTKVMGKKSIISLGATCVSIPAAGFPTALDLPSISVAMATPAPLITGISAGIRALKRRGKLREDEEINVFAVAGDGGSADIGFAGLSAAAERNDDGVYFCFDNEAYMNTGIQRSGLTPGKAWTNTSLDGKVQPKKDMPMIMAAHQIPYVATTSVGHPDDLVQKVSKAKEMPGGFRYIHTLGACTAGWRFPENKAIEITRMAVECGMWILYEIVEGEFNITYKPHERKPVREYLSSQGRFAHLNKQDIDEIQSEVDKQCLKYDF